MFRSQELVKLAVHALEDKVELCRKYLELKKKGSAIKAELTELQAAMKKVIDWIHGPGEELLNAQKYKLPETITQAMHMKKEHDKLEIQCLVC